MDIDPEKELAFYLLKIKQDGDDKTPFTITEYFLLDVSKAKEVITTPLVIIENLKIYTTGDPLS